MKEMKLDLTCAIEINWGRHFTHSYITSLTYYLSTFLFAALIQFWVKYFQQIVLPEPQRTNFSPLCLGKLRKKYWAPDFSFLDQTMVFKILMTQEILACPTQSKLKGIIYPTTDNERMITMQIPNSLQPPSKKNQGLKLQNLSKQYVHTYYQKYLKIQPNQPKHLGYLKKSLGIRNPCIQPWDKDLYLPQG